MVYIPVGGMDQLLNKTQANPGCCAGRQNAHSLCRAGSRARSLSKWPSIAPSDTEPGTSFFDKRHSTVVYSKSTFIHDTSRILNLGRIWGFFKRNNASYFFPKQVCDFYCQKQGKEHSFKHSRNVVAPNSKQLCL